MMLVDSSVWIDFLGAKDTPQTAFLKTALFRQKIFSADLVIAEVLQGTRDERDFAIACDLLLRLEALTVAGRGIAIESARNYRFLRARGITVRKTIDTLIATRCILDGLALLYSDRDFDPFVMHLGLRSAMDLATGVN